MQLKAKDFARKLMACTALLLASHARADEPFVLAESQAQHLRVIAESGQAWCGPHLSLRMVLQPDSPIVADRGKQIDMINRLRPTIQQSCPAAVWAEITVESGGKLQASLTMDRAHNWTVLPTTQTAAQPPASPPPAPVASATAAAEHLAQIGLRPDSIRQIDDILLPYRDSGKSAGKPDVAKALDTLWQEGLNRPTPPQANNEMADHLSAALKSGPPNPKLMPQLAAVYDAVAHGTKAAQRTALVALLKQAGRPIPSDAELNDRLAAAAAARDKTLQPSQHLSFRRGAATVQVDHSPTADNTRISVVGPGRDGSLTRVTFSGRQTEQPSADGSALTDATETDPEQTVTQADSDAERAQIEGDWTDQDGHTWTIVGKGAGKGDALTATEKQTSGHNVAYDSQWSLGVIDGKHLVDNVLDMDDGLPMDVRQALASSFHPPFAIRLDYIPDKDELHGIWISGTVTYNGMSHAVKVVDDPTWDKALTLTRHPPAPKYFLFAHTATGRQNIDKFYLGVATDIEAQFDKPYDRDSINIDVSAGGQKITLVASRVDPQGYIFRTTPFLPGPPAANKNENWGDAPHTQERK